MGYSFICNINFVNYILHMKTRKLNLQEEIFKLIYFCLIVKQVHTAYLNHSRVHFLETSLYCCHMRNHGCDPCGVRTHDPEFARQTPYLLGHHSPLTMILEMKLHALLIFCIYLHNVK